MKLVLTETQLKKISEIHLFGGVMKASDSSYDLVFEKLSDFDLSKLVVYVKEYLKKNLGYPEKINPKELKKFCESLKNGWFDDKDSSFGKIFKSRKMLNLICVFFRKKIWGLEKKGNLEVWVNKSYYNTTYVFFDKLLELSVGYIKVSPIDKSDIRRSLKIPKKTYQVEYSTVDSEFKGQGYGKEMYFALIDDVDMLFSDVGLYQDSLNIWVNVLPNYFNTYALVSDRYNTKYKVMRVTTDEKPPNYENVKRYFAFKDMSNLKIK